MFGELQKLVEDSEALNTLTPDGIYSITTDNIDVNAAIVHTHYRLPLVAAPSGLNDIFNDGVDRQRVGSESAGTPGWLNASGLAPTGFKFEYNIAQDASLNALWPIDADKIAYAHLEVDGITNTDIVINQDGIFWKNNLLGDAPFAEDYVSEENQGTEIPILVLDFIN